VNPNGTEQANEQRTNNHRTTCEPIPLADYARRHHLTQDAVRMRIGRGRLTGEKRDGRWYVIDGISRAEPTPNKRTNSARTTEQETEQSTGQALAAAVAALTAQLAEKDRQLAAREREISELHILLQTSQQNEQRLLSATVPAAPESPESRRDESAAGTSNQTAPEGVQRALRPSWRWPWQRW
jgi:hypothetical protein